MLPTITRRSFRPFYVPDIFDDAFFNVFPGKSSSIPAVNIREDEQNFTLDLAIPGLDKKDLKIDMNENVLTISSETSKESEDKHNGYKRKEFSYSTFSRSFYVPENVTGEKIEANYKDGVLTVTLPKKDEGKNQITRKIEIS
jgi:HSP20 family protein